MTHFRPLTSRSSAAQAWIVTAIGVALLPPAPSFAESKIPVLPPAPQSWAVEVNSLQDGEITADGELTLREAIALTNGTVSLTDLSALEQAQVTPLAPDQPSQITWAVVSENPLLSLQSPLPPLARANLVLDGTLGDRKVLLSPATAATLPRGLTILADGVRVQNLALQGFTTANTSFGSGFKVESSDSGRANTLTGAIVITQGEGLYDLEELPWVAQLTPPQGVEITGVEVGGTPSSFGVVLFEGLDSRIHGNRFEGLDGSAILTGKEASGSQIYDNEIRGNGGAGMADGIRLEGTIAGVAIYNNRICENAGSGIFLFKPQGSVSIRDNDLHFNGAGSHRGAIYLTGSGHEVLNNHITHQVGGGGVVVAAYPRSVQNRIQDNRFAALEGLSIDLVVRRHTGVWDNAIGDGVNPPRDSENRRLDTANRGINAPQFLGDEFFLFEETVTIAGEADPGAIVDVYKVSQSSGRTAGADFRDYAPLTELLVSLPVDTETGRFQIDLNGLEPGDRISAIATDPSLGTSEPAKNAVIRTIDSPPPDSTPAIPSQTIPCGPSLSPTP